MKILQARQWLPTSWFKDILDRTWIFLDGMKMEMCSTFINDGPSSPFKPDRTSFHNPYQLKKVFQYLIQWGSSKLYGIMLCDGLLFSRSIRQVSNIQCPHPHHICFWFVNRTYVMTYKNWQTTISKHASTLPQLLEFVHTWVGGM